MPSLPAALAQVLHYLPNAAFDADLLRTYAIDHDAEAFRALVARHGPLVLGVCRRILNDAHRPRTRFRQHSSCSPGGPRPSVGRRRSRHGCSASPGGWR